MSADDETASKDELVLAGAPAPAAITRFAAGEADLVLGGTFGDLPLAQRVKLPRGSLRFDPASGLFGLLPVRTKGPLASREARLLLSQALDRDSIVAALRVPGLVARTTLLEPGLEGMAAPAAPAWAGEKLADRLPALQAQARRLFAKAKPAVRVAVPDSPGGALLLRAIQRSWGALGIEVERAERGSGADFLLVDDVAPSAGAAWFVRRFRCTQAALCDPEADRLMDAARASSVPAQRYALLGQAAAMLDGDALFIPIAAPVRWSLVSSRVRNFAGNRYARHTLIGLHASGAAGG